MWLRVYKQEPVKLSRKSTPRGATYRTPWNTSGCSEGQSVPDDQMCHTHTSGHLCHHHMCFDIELTSQKHRFLFSWNQISLFFHFQNV